MATPETRRQLLAAVAACDDKKGEDTRILELDPADSGLADFFLITSATNDRQVVAIADEIEMRLKKDFGLYATSVEGRRQAEWILLDYVDIVIHVFLQEKRAFYDIERLRKSARPLTSAELEADLKAALAQKTLAVRGSASSIAKKAAKKTAKKTAKTSPGKSPATKAALPKTPSAKPSNEGESHVTAKPAKKAALKAAAKPSFKPGKELKAKPAVKAAPAKTAAKPALKPALKSAMKSAKTSAAKPVSPMALVEARMPGRAAPTALGAKPPIVKCEAPPEAPIVGGAKPPIVKSPNPSASVPAKAVKPAKKAAKKAPVKTAIRKNR